MNLDEITKRQNALIKDYCISCDKPLPPRAAFCEHCGPPILPEETPESKTGFWLAMVKISLMTLVFAVIVAYKAEWDYKSFFENVIEAPVPEQAQEVPEDDEDYHLIHYVNVSFANIREEPNKKGKNHRRCRQGGTPGHCRKRRSLVSGGHGRQKRLDRHPFAVILY